MPRLPMYEQQTIAEPSRASSQQFGSGVAEAQVEQGGVFVNLGDAIQRRSEVIDRVRLQNDFDAEAMRMLEAAQTEGDITSDETLSNLHQNLRGLADQMVGSHRGRMGSKAEFRTQIENQVGQYYKSALNTQIKAQKSLLAETFEQSVNSLGLSAMDAPDLLPDLITEAENKLTELRPALTAQEEQAFRAAMRSRLTQSTVEGFYNRGDYERASEILNNPDMNKFLDPNAARTMKIKVATEQGRMQAEERAREQRRQSWSARLGRDLTPQEQMRVDSLPTKKGDMTISDQITEYEMVTGRPASQAVIDRMYKVEPRTTGGGSAASQNLFGNSLRGRALQMVNDGAMLYASGMLDPEQARQFEMAAAEAYSPVERHDPLTGQWTRFQPTIPTHVQEALQRGSGAYGSPPMPMGRPAVGGGGAQAPQGMMGPGQQMLPGAGQPSDFAMSAADAPPPQAPQTEQGRTIWERRQNIAGPVAGVRAGVQRIPGVGPLAAGAVFGEEETRQADADRTYVDNASRDLIRILQNNPRFAEGERQAIEKEVSIGPEFFRSVDSYEGRLMGVAESLQKRRQDAQRILQTETSADQRKWAMDAISAIDNFHQNLGVPMLITDPSQLEGLPPGTRVMDKRGNEFRTR